MPEICTKCGLIKELCVCDILDKEDAKTITVYETAKKFKKLVTIIKGIDDKKLVECAKELKRKLACGGTVKEGLIILQGSHSKKVKNILVALAYPAEIIEVLGKK